MHNSNNKIIIFLTKNHETYYLLRHLTIDLLHIVFENHLSSFIHYCITKGEFNQSMIGQEINLRS